MYVFIDSTDRTGDVIDNSIRIMDELQERVNKCSFKLVGNKPSEGEEVKVYDGYPILSSTSTSVTLRKDYNKSLQNNLFRVGDTVVVAINQSDEENAVISSISSDSGNLKLTMTASFSNTPTAGELCGVKKFAGNIFRPSDRNIRVLENIEYFIDCLDYTRIFDKRLINDTYEDKDARYIVNDFCNNFINKNQEIDSMNYADNSAVQAEWIESGDGDNPTVDTSNLREGTSSVTMPWTNSGGTATFSATPVSVDVQDFTGAASGTPTKGIIAFWYDCLDYTAITNFKLRIGSDSSNYAEITITPTSNDWVYETQELSDASITGTPDWTALDYAAIVVTETSSSNIRIDGIRILEREHFRHYPYVETSVEFNDFRIPRIKPTEVMQRLADELAWYWYIDYDRNIRLFNESTNFAPFSMDETSDNFRDLSVTYDISRLINQQFVKGGDEVSEEKYSQVEEGDSFTREWLTKNKFKNLEVLFDDGSVTDTMEGGTTTTNVNATGHGLVTGDYMVNRSRSNAVRKITKVDDDNFTVAAVASQTSGDTFSTFTEMNIGIEGLDDETTLDYVYNFNEKSIRATTAEATIDAGDFLVFRYNEVFPILVKRRDNVSISNMISVLGYSDGIFDGQPIIDRTIKTRSEAVAVADATLNKYSNVVITATFTTNQEGLQSGQLISIKDTTSSSRNINQNFLIQKVVQRQIEWGENVFQVTCSSLLFGVMELLQQMLKQGRKLEVDEDARIDNVEDQYETVNISEVVTSAVDDNLQSENVSIADVISEETVFTPPFVYEPDGASVSRYNLASYS